MVAGTGREENRNNSYNGQRASFAQPSGLCIAKPLNNHSFRNGSGPGGPEPSLYIADSESSSVRRMSLDSLGRYKVLNVAGGSPDPSVSFSFSEAYSLNLNMPWYTIDIIILSMVFVLILITNYLHTNEFLKII